MIWLHTYTGLLAGWLIFAVFLTGTLSYYNQEITHWMTSSNLAQQSQEKLVSHGLETLKTQAPNATQWRIQLPDDRGSHYRISYREGRERNSIYMDPEALAIQDTPETRGGNFFRTFHYTLSMRQWGGRYLTGIAAMLMLIAVFTGIYTHRRFFKDFFTLRNKDKLKFITDFHAVSGVITIPFCFVICFSALLIYISMYQPFAINHYFDSFRALDKEVSTRHQSFEPSGLQGPNLTNLTDFQPNIERKWGADAALSSITINHPNDANSQIIFTKRKTDILSNKAETLAFSSQGEPQADMDAERLPRMVRRIFYGLHEAHFAPPTLRAMLFLLGMFSTVLISTGMVIWLRKRQQKQQKASYVLVERINNTAFYGLSLAIASYFLSSKLSIASLSLATYELPMFFYTWLGSLLAVLIFKPKQGKPLLLSANAFAYSAILFIDLINLLTNSETVFTLPYLTIVFWLALTVIYFIRASLKSVFVNNSKTRPAYA